VRRATRIDTNTRAISSLVWLPLALATVVCGAYVAALSPATQPSWRLSSSSASIAPLSAFADQSQVEAAVTKAASLKSVPKNLEPPLASLVSEDLAGTDYLPQCQVPNTFDSSEKVTSCTFGDLQSSRTVVLTGDSRAEMWFNTLNTIAVGSQLKLVLLTKSGCPAAIGSYRVNNNGTLSNSSWPACSAWHNFVISTIKALAPEAVIIATSVDLELTTSGSGLASPSTTEADFAKFIGRLPTGPKVVVLGGFPSPGSSGLSPTVCLSKGHASIQACSFKLNSDETHRNEALAQAARGKGAAFINQAPWFCARVCPPIIHGTVVYTIDAYHIDSYYTRYLTGVLWAALKPDLQ
jgi:hypothetical protein